MTQFKLVPVVPTEAMRKAAQDKLASEGLIVTDWLIHTAYSAMLAAAPSPWISVGERLPDEHKAEYLCLFDDGHQQVSEWLHDETQGWVFWYGDPTHWMPLPEAPKVKP